MSSPAAPSSAEPGANAPGRERGPLRFLLRAPSRESRDTLFMVALIGWTIAPHLGHLPPGVALLAFAVLAWRARLAWKQAPLPGRNAVIALLVLAAAITWWSDRTLLGKEAGVTLLVMLMALKTLELRARRDALVVVFLGFFLVLTHFLYSQSLATAVAMGLSVWGWLTALTLAHMPAGRPPITQAARLAGRAALIGTPVMVLLFLLFPRLGPLWALPGDNARTGLSDRLELGSVADLANDDSIAFRVRFTGRAPAANTLYFRGPVLVDTDGRSWHAEAPLPPSADVVRAVARASGDTIDRAQGPSVSYEASYEPSQITWLPVLEQTLPAAGNEPGGVEVLAGGEGIVVRPDTAGQWRTSQALNHRIRVRVTAWPTHHLETHEAPAKLRRDLRLPPDAHPRMKAWARALRREAGDVDADLLAAALMRHIRTQPYVYTLTPGTYDGDAVDEFWFDRRAGFCEHYATAFTVAMRAMGVPARVVTGYQGVDPEPQDGEFVVRQAYAHAWSEYWQPGRGWTRADPTAAVSPDRIERGRALRPRPGFVGSAISAMSPGLRDQLRQFWETLDNRWNQWVLSYDRRSQFDLLKRLGIDTPDTEDLGQVMIGVIVAVSCAGAVAAWWDARRRTPGQRLRRRLAASLKPLAGHGLDVPVNASAGTLAARMRSMWGDAAADLARRLDAIERARYGPPGDGASSPTRDDWRATQQAARALAQSLTPSREATSKPGPGATAAGATGAGR
jgi:transglutaminase-like putative cysteine protease